ncbi:hypothetical protein LWI28_020226 [Acer negundo]|uniref:Uncharacterized protein n=1 Tax=Acer negundo TaxID=4023 RepID=A0AAD5JDX1_ACENE|nr:hypothetical protein LWI28_020226 [Acer negundo]
MISRELRRELFGRYMRRHSHSRSRSRLPYRHRSHEKRSHCSSSSSQSATTARGHCILLPVGDSVPPHIQGSELGYVFFKLGYFSFKQIKISTVLTHFMSFAGADVPASKEQPV